MLRRSNKSSYFISFSSLSFPFFKKFYPAPLFWFVFILSFLQGTLYKELNFKKRKVEKGQVGKHQGSFSLSRVPPSRKKNSSGTCTKCLVASRVPMPTPYSTPPSRLLSPSTHRTWRLWLPSLKPPVLSCGSALSEITCLCFSFLQDQALLLLHDFFSPSHDSLSPVPPCSFPVFCPGRLRFMGLPSPPLPISISLTMHLSIRSFGFTAHIALGILPFPIGGM